MSSYWIITIFSMNKRTQWCILAVSVLWRNVIYRMNFVDAGNLAGPKYLIFELELKPFWHKNILNLKYTFTSLCGSCKTRLQSKFNCHPLYLYISKYTNIHFLDSQTIWSFFLQSKRSFAFCIFIFFCSTGSHVLYRAYSSLKYVL